MNEDQEKILMRMLGRVPNSVDRREGSIAHDTSATTAYEIEQLEKKLDRNLANTFAGTAVDREWLIEAGREIGISPNPSTYAIRKGVFTPASLEIRIGERFNFDDLNFIVTEKLADGEYALQCETLGTVGNIGTGNLVPIQFVNGLATAELTSDILIYGEDEESTEDFRIRYFATLPTMTLDGNRAQYDKWCREFAGIGNFKIFSLWNGVNTVKVSILSAENTVASQTLIDDFQEYLDPNREGVGMGKAPIGAIVTVTTATEVPINVKAQIMLRKGYDSLVNLEKDIVDYLKTLNYVRTTVSHVAISAIVNNNESVEIALDVTMNGKKENIELTEEQIAKLENLEVEVVR